MAYKDQLILAGDDVVGLWEKIVEDLPLGLELDATIAVANNLFYV
jgi:hypothetical protein